MLLCKDAKLRELVEEPIILDVVTTRCMPNELENAGVEDLNTIRELMSAICFSWN